MTPDYTEVVCDKAADYAMAITFSGDSNFDRTGYSWAGQVREVVTASGTAEAAFTFDSTQLPNTLYCKLTAAVTGALDPLKRYRYDIVETDASGIKSVLVRGTFRVRQLVTK